MATITITPATSSTIVFTIMSTTTGIIAVVTGWPASVCRTRSRGSPLVTYTIPSTTPTCSVIPRVIGGTINVARSGGWRTATPRSTAVRATTNASGSQKFVASATTPRTEAMIPANTACTIVKTPKIAPNTRTPKGMGPTMSSVPLRRHSPTTVTRPIPTLSTGNSSTMLPGDQPRTTTPYSSRRLTITPGTSRPSSRAATVGAGHPAADRTAHELLQTMLVVDPVAERGAQLVDQLLSYLVEDVVVLDEAAGMDVERDDALCVHVDHGDDRDEALGAQDLAIRERLFGETAHARTVDEDVPRVDPTDLARLPVNEVHHVTVFGDDDPVLRHTGGGGKIRVGHEVAHLAVDRHHVARLDDVVAVEELPRARVTRDMDQRIALVDDARTDPGQAVDHAVDRVLVAGDERRGEEHGVARAELDVRVLAVRHPCQC